VHIPREKSLAEKFVTSEETASYNLMWITPLDFAGRNYSLPLTPGDGTFTDFKQICKHLKFKL